MKPIRFLYWRIILRCRNCHEVAQNSMRIQTRMQGEIDRLKAMLCNTWKGTASQTKGMQRMARKIKKLRVQLADMTGDYHRWHDEFMKLKYPEGGQRKEVINADTNVPIEMIEKWKDVNL